MHIPLPQSKKKNDHSYYPKMITTDTNKQRLISTKKHKRKHTSFLTRLKKQANGGTRTHNLWIRSPMRYPIAPRKQLTTFLTASLSWVAIPHRVQNTRVYVSYCIYLLIVSLLWLPQISHPYHSLPFGLLSDSGFWSSPSCAVQSDPSLADLSSSVIPRVRH